MSSVNIVPVLLTGVGGGGHGEQIMKALRMGQLRYRIIGVDASPYCANRALVDDFYVVPRATDPAYLDAILRIARNSGCVAIFHGSEAEMSVLSKARSDIEALGIYVPVNQPSVMQICMDKVQTLEFFAQRGFRVPLFRRIESLADTEGFATFPAILKPSIGGGGSANTYIVQDDKEFRRITEYLLQVSDQLTVQEYIGTPDAEFTVGVLFGSDSALINSIGIQKIINNALTIRVKVPNRTDRSELGPYLVVSTGISQGKIGRWSEVTRQCEQIARALNPVAPVNIQCRVVAGQVVPFEINPRFSGTTSLRAMAGYNEPDILIRRDVFGEAVEAGFDYREMTVLRGLSEFVLPEEVVGALERGS